MCAQDEVLLLQESMLQTGIPDELCSVHACVGITATVIGTDVGTQCRTPRCGDGEVTTGQIFNGQLAVTAFDCQLFDFLLDLRSVLPQQKFEVMD